MELFCFYLLISSYFHTYFVFDGTKRLAAAAYWRISGRCHVGQATRVDSGPGPQRRDSTRRTSGRDGMVGYQTERAVQESGTCHAASGTTWSLRLPMLIYLSSYHSESCRAVGPSLEPTARCHDCILLLRCEAAIRRLTLTDQIQDACVGHLGV